MVGIEVNSMDQSDPLSLEGELCKNFGQSNQKNQINFDKKYKIINPKQCWCGKVYQTNKALGRHIRVVHQKLNSYKCDQCQNKSASKSELQRHINSVHENLRPFQCEICSKSFFQRNKLSQKGPIPFPEAMLNAT